MVLSRGEPEVSILCATRDRAHRLGPFFAAVAELAPRPSWELIVVDNGSGDGTIGLLRQHAERLAPRMIAMHQREPGKSRALNAALRVARGRLLAFTDDDCYPAPDWVARIVEVFARRPVDYAGGRMLPYGPDDARHAVWTSRVTIRIPPGSLIEAGAIQGGNLIVTRRLIETIGGFDEELGPGTPYGSEDLDLVARASEHGFEGGIFPGPVVYHHHRRHSARARARQTRFYDVGRGAHYCKRILTGTLPRQHLFRWLRDTHLRRLPVLARELRGALGYLSTRLSRSDRRGG